jgi:hypothetical protein
MTRVVPLVMRSGTTSRPAAGELVPPGGRQVPCPGGDDDPVVRASIRVPFGAVCAQHLDPAVSGCLQGGRGFVGDVLVNVDGHDVAGRAGQLGEEGRVVAGPGADLQDPVTGLDIELLQHRGDDTGRGRRAER